MESQVQSIIDRSLGNDEGPGLNTAHGKQVDTYCFRTVYTSSLDLSGGQYVRKEERERGVVESLSRE